MKPHSPRLFYLSGLLIIICFLGFAYYLEQYDGVIPCALCILQRIDFILLGLAFLVGGLFRFKRLGQIIMASISILIGMAGMLFSGRQIWLQHLPPNSHPDCGVSLQYLLNVLPPDEIVKRIFSGSAECAQKSWELFSLSLAEWSFLCFCLFVIACCYQLIQAVCSMDTR